jgi:hypothetical protein
VIVLRRFMCVMSKLHSGLEKFMFLAPTIDYRQPGLEVSARLHVHDDIVVN